MSSPDLLGVRRHWWHELNRYHWFVLAVACLGWLFDCFDQQIFTLAKTPAMKDLLGAGATKDDVASAATNATAIFLIGWGAGFSSASSATGSGGRRRWSSRSCSTRFSPG